jgi:hypothetical protein
MSYWVSEATGGDCCQLLATAVDVLVQVQTRNTRGFIEQTPFGWIEDRYRTVFGTLYILRNNMHIE